MLGWLLEALWGLLEALGLVATSMEEEQGNRVTVKAVSGQSLSLALQPEWTIRDVKLHLAPQLQSEVEELRIIFAGKELRDDVAVSSCDLGNQSVLHAVRVLRKPDDQEVGVVGLAASPVVCSQAPAAGDQGDEEDKGDQGDEPLASTLLDFQLGGDSSSTRSLEDVRAHFYTWCNIQDGLSPAKLRVKCGGCGEGALVLHRDPGDWQDVLQTDRISGSCAACCQDSVPAVFYFRCSCDRHEAEDYTVPLYLVKSNLSSVPCLACTGEESPVLVFPCTLQHVICVPCFRDYCTSRLSERQFLVDPELGYTLPCPVACEGSMVREPQHFRLLGKELYQRYERFGAEELVLQSGGVLCPQPGCGAGILTDEVGSDCRRVGCQACDYVFCRDCLQGAHLGSCVVACGGGGETGDYPSMDPGDPRASRARWSGADPSSVTIRVITKPCPGCRTPTERSGGCMHMICTKAGCGLSWCWVCQVEWTRDCMANHWFG